MTVSTVPQQLRECGRCLIQTSGTSMEPLLHHRKSSVMLEMPSRPLRKMDVVLFRLGGRLVLHRIIKIRQDTFYICGDNTLQLDEVPRSDILGVMTGLYPDETDYFLSVDDPEYRRYVRTWWLRHFLLFARAWLHGLLRRPQ